jgi:hypothetical protein
MNTNRVLALLIALLAVPLCAAQSDIPQWAAEIRAVAIAGCRESILSHAEQDFLKRHNLTELPPYFRERIAPAIEPFLAVCNCSVDRMEKEWTVEYFMLHQSEVLAKAQELSKGECAPIVNRTPPQHPNEQPRPGVLK